MRLLTLHATARIGHGFHLTSTAMVALIFLCLNLGAPFALVGWLNKSKNKHAEHHS